MVDVRRTFTLENENYFVIGLFYIKMSRDKLMKKISYQF